MFSSIERFFSLKLYKFGLFEDRMGHLPEIDTFAVKLQLNIQYKLTLLEAHW